MYRTVTGALERFRRTGVHRPHRLQVNSRSAHHSGDRDRPVGPAVSQAACGHGHRHRQHWSPMCAVPPVHRSGRADRFVAEKLPTYMVRPRSWCWMLPLNTSANWTARGCRIRCSARRRRLPAPRTAAERSWRRVRRCARHERVGIDDNFSTWRNSCRTRWWPASRRPSAPYRVRALFETPTVAGLAARGSRGRPMFRVRPWPQRARAGAAVARAAAHVVPQSVRPTVPTYNLPFVVRLRGQVDIEALQLALTTWWRGRNRCHIFPESVTVASSACCRIDEVDLASPRRRSARPN